MNKNLSIFSDDESIEKESPLLHFISRENPFIVPEGYFDNLPSQVMERCREQVVSNQWSVVSFPWSVVWKVLGSSLAVAVICFLVFHTNNKPVSYETMLQTIPDSLIIAHLENNITYINESTLEEFQADDINDSTGGNNEDIITYLMNHNVNVSDIENEPLNHEN